MKPWSAFILTRRELLLITTLLVIILAISASKHYWQMQRGKEYVYTILHHDTLHDSEVSTAPYQGRTDYYKDRELRSSIAGQQKHQGGLDTQKLCSFNPNQVSYEELSALGFPHRLASNLLNYREKVGFFSEKEDLLRLYAMDSLTYLAISPFVEIPAKPGQTPAQTPLIDINAVDSSDLIRVYGIGPVLAGRIMKYRTMVGGFYSYQQLEEVYHLPDSMIRKLEETFALDAGRITKIPVNTASFQKLLSHPYLDYHDVKSIMAVRKYKPLEGMVDLKKANILDDRKIKQIEPYLSF